MSILIKKILGIGISIVATTSSEPQKVDWWSNGFNPNSMDYETSNLTIRSRIDFSGSPEAMRMYDMLEQQYRNKRKKLAEKGNLIPRGNYVVTYEW